MTTFTIATDNNITAFAAPEAAQDMLALGAMPFTSQKELAQLAADWPTNRLVEVWNSFAGVAPFDELKPVTKFTDRATAVNRIWQAIQKLASGAQEGAQDAPKAATATQEASPQKKAPKTKKSANVAKAKPAKKAAAAKSAPKAKRAAKAQESAGPREGSKTAQVIAMLQRKNGATLAEIMDRLSWQKHSVRGFMAGAMKKAGYAVESFKSDKGERTYRINP